MTDGKITMPKFSAPTCRGSYALGTACGHCERCTWERDQMKAANFGEATMASPTPMTPEVQAVVDYLSVWNEDPYNGRCITQLRAIYGAYLASTQPKGVKPEDVAPGTRFTFVRSGRRPWPDATYLMAVRRKSRWRFCVRESDFFEEHFSDEDRIIPIEGEEE